MKQLTWVLISLALFACKEKSKEPAATAPAGSATAPVGSATAPTGSARAPTGSAAAPTGSAAAPTGSAGSGAEVAPAPAAPIEPGCEGWRAAKVEHTGMGEESVTVTCAGGKITSTALSVSARGGAETTSTELTREEWNQLWQQLDEAGWRALPNDCPDVVPPPDSFGVTELELEITDGTTTKKITCAGANVTAAHEQIMTALE